MAFKISYQQPMSKHNTWRAGGIAKMFFIPENIEQLAEFLAQNTAPILLLGLGSNLLIKDRGFDGVVIHTKYLNHMSYNGRHLVIEAGVPLARIARFAVKHKQYGAEFLSAIPGTLGGALAMNAGAYRGQIWDLVHQVETIDTNGSRHIRQPSDFVVGYRQVHANYPDEYFTGAHLQLNATPAKDALSIKQLLAKRNRQQPIGTANCGSVFVNPNGYYAAQLIEQCGLKNVCIGDACVSAKHANFIINRGRASATDIENLIHHIQETVRTKFAIELTPEVVIV